MQEPDIILLDEPTAHLDYGNQLRIIKMVKELAEQGFAVIMTTHTPDHAIMLQDKVGILDNNGNMKIGLVQNILTEETLSSVYDTKLKIVYIDKIGRESCVAAFP